MYSGGFYPFPDAETSWAWWARNIYFNRYMDPPRPVYQQLLSLVQDKDYFVITTNVDHQFQRAGFDKDRLFYTQGDFGLFQSVHPSTQKTYDNEEWVMKAMEAQGFVRDGDGAFVVPESGELKMRIPAALIPKCPDDGSDVTMNLRVDGSFVEDAGWHRASAAYADFLHRCEGRHVLYLELGVGANTPVIVKYPFWQMTLANERRCTPASITARRFARARLIAEASALTGTLAMCLRLCPCHYCEPSVPETERDAEFGVRILLFRRVDWWVAEDGG